MNNVYMYVYYYLPMTSAQAVCSFLLAPTVHIFIHPCEESSRNFQLANACISQLQQPLRVPRAGEVTDTPPSA